MSHRWACDCCEHGSCVDRPSDCPDSTAFSFTQPAFNVNLATTAVQTAFVSANYTAGAVSCTGESACLLDLRCHDCGSTGSCPSCEEFNYDITTIPCILRRCDGTDCDDAYEWEWEHGTFSGQAVGGGSAVVTIKSCGTRTYTPCANTMMWIPQVTSIDLNPSGSGGAYWEYSIIWWTNIITSYIGCSTDGDSNCACGVYKDDCGRIGGAAWQQIIDGVASPFFWRTGVFTVRKENDSCFRAEWNGATQTGSGTNVISITPPSSGGNMGIQVGSKNGSSTGSCGHNWDDDCSTCIASGTKYFQIDTGDSFYTSYGNTASWTLT